MTLYWPTAGHPCPFCGATTADAAEIARLREALEWYGEQTRLARIIHSEGDTARRALDRDGGERAHRALAPEPEEET